MYQKNKKLVIFEDSTVYFFSQGFFTGDKNIEQSYQIWIKEMAEFFLRRANLPLYGSDRIFALNYLQDLLEIALNRRLASIVEERDLFLKEVSPIYHNKKLKEIYFFGGIEKKFYQKLVLQLTPAKQEYRFSIFPNLWSRLMIYWEIANFAGMDGVEKNSVKVADYLQKIQIDLDLIQQTSVSAPASVPLFEGSAQPFVSLLQHNKTNPLLGVPILVSWKDESPANKTGWKSRAIESNEKGEARFIFPAFFTRENSQIKFEIRRSAFKISPRIKDPLLLEQFNKILLSLDKKTIFFNPTVVSDVKSKKISVMLLQFDRGGNITSDDKATEILVSEMEKEGYAFLSFSKDSWSEMNGIKPDTPSSEIFEKIKPFVPAESQWLLIGNIGLTSFNQADNLFDGMASGPIYLFDKKGQLLYEAVASASGRGNNAETVLSVVWRTLGRNIRRDLLKIFP